MRECYNCHTPIDADLVIEHDTLCPKCHQPLHTCVNCKFYEPGAYHDCHDGVDEYQEDKEEENFCDSFCLGDGGASKQKTRNAAKAKAESLFKF
jgi:hypothetical protein